MKLVLVMLAACAAAPAESGFVQRMMPIDDGRISYLERKGRSPALVLIPGSFAGAGDYDGVIASLDPSRHIVIVEVRGHGQSWPPPGNGSIEQFAEDVKRVADHAKLGPCYLGGHSIGGMIAIEAAGHWPQRWKGVISIEGWTHHSVAREAFTSDAGKRLSPDLQARLDEIRRPVMMRWRKDQVTAFARIWRQWNGLEILEQTQLPVLEVWGDRGQPRPSRSAMKIPGRPNIDLVWIAGASHYLPMERPADVARAIGAFMTKVESGGR